MKLFELKPRTKYYASGSVAVSRDNPWNPWYEKCFHFVIRAETKEKAREIASEDAGDEGKEAWLNDEYSVCIELTNEGNPGIIVADCS